MEYILYGTKAILFIIGLTAGAYLGMGFMYVGIGYIGKLFCWLDSKFDIDLTDKS
jgi:hypothetical protein